MTWFYLAIALLFAFCVLLSVMLVRERRKVISLSQQVSALSQRQLQSDETIVSQQRIASEEMQELRSAQMVFSKQLSGLEQQLLQTRQRQQEIAEQDPATRLYNKASKLVAEGASIDDVMQACDLPRAEAELLFNLHKQG